LSLFKDEHVPQRLLDVFIKNNNQGDGGNAPGNNLIQADIEEETEDEEEKAETLQLSASFVNSGKGYLYNISDVKKIEK